MRVLFLVFLVITSGCGLPVTTTTQPLIAQATVASGTVSDWLVTLSDSASGINIIVDPIGETGPPTDTPSLRPYAIIEWGPNASETTSTNIDVGRGVNVDVAGKFARVRVGMAQVPPWQMSATLDLTVILSPVASPRTSRATFTNYADGYTWNTPQIPVWFNRPAHSDSVIQVSSDSQYGYDVIFADTYAPIYSINVPYKNLLEPVLLTGDVTSAHIGVYGSIPANFKLVWGLQL